MKLSISIVNWNTKDILKECLEAIVKSDFTDYEITVVDNNSSDNSAEMVKALFPNVGLLSNTQNLGFAKGNNQVIKQSSGEYILILNPDIIVYPDTLKQMIDFMDNHNDVGALGIKLATKDGTEIKTGYYRRYPSITQTLFFYTMLENLSLKNKFLRNRYWEKENTGQISEIHQIPGACLLLRRKTINEVGLFDERFKLFFEDVDLCYRIGQSNWKLVFNPKISAIHIGAQSISQLSYPELAGTFFNSMYVYFRKHYSWIKAVCVKTIIILNTLLKISVFYGLLVLSKYKRDKRKEHIQMLKELLKQLWKM